MKKKVLLFTLLCTVIMVAFAICASAAQITISYVNSQDPFDTTNSLDKTAYTDGKQIVEAGESFTLPTTASSSYLETEGYQLIWYTANGKTYKAGQTVSFNEDTRLYRCAAKEVYTTDEFNTAVVSAPYTVILMADIEMTKSLGFEWQNQFVLDFNGHNLTLNINANGIGAQRAGKHFIGEGTFKLTNPDNKVGNYYVINNKSHSHNGHMGKNTIGVDVTIDAPNYHLYDDGDGACVNGYPWVKIYGKVNVYSLGRVTNANNRSPRIEIYESADITITGKQIFWDTSSSKINNQKLQLTIYGGNFTLPKEAEKLAFWTNDYYDSTIHLNPALPLTEANMDAINIYAGSYNLMLPIGLLKDGYSAIHNSETNTYDVKYVACTIEGSNGEHSFVEAELYGEDINCLDGRRHYFRCECGAYYVEEVLLIGHDYSIVTNESQATPEKLGVNKVTCARCGDYYTYEFAFSPANIELSITVKTESGLITGKILASDIYELVIVEEIGSYTCTVNAIKEFTINGVTYTKNDIVIAVIPSGATNITAGVFDSMENLKEVVIMDRANVTFVKNTFKNCPLLEKLTIGDCDVVFAQGGGENQATNIVNNCPMLTTIDISKANATFNNYSFASDKTVKHLLMGENKTYFFGTDSFRHSVLEEVILPDNSNVTLQQKCFAETETIKYVYVGKNCIANGKIGDDNSHKSIFGGNSYLSKVVLMEGINYIGQWSLSTKKPGNLYQPLCDLVVYAHSETFSFHNEAFNDRAGNYTVYIYSANPNITNATSSSNYVIYKGIGHAYEQNIITPSTCVTPGKYGYAPVGCDCGIDYRENSYVTVANKKTELNNVTHEPFGTEESELPLSNEHAIGTVIADIIYTNYFEKGITYFYCKDCGLATVAEETPSATPLFIAVGYSTDETNGKGVSHTIKANRDAIELYKSLNNDFYYGVVAGIYTDGTPIIGVASAKPNVIMADMSKNAFDRIQIKISGIDEDKIETALICCAYAIENANEPVIKYLSGNKTLDEAESIAYDAVLALPPVQEIKEN